MTSRYGLESIRQHRIEIDTAKRDDDAWRLLVAYRGELRVWILGIVHGHDGKAGLPRTACGIRWVPGYSDRFPQGEPVEDEVDCMSCLVKTGLK